MKLRLGYVVLFLGLAALIGLTVARLVRERQFYELQLRAQADSIETGLRQKWRGYLLDLAKNDKLPKDFAVRWDRSGRLMRSRFYPDPGMQLEWSDYRVSTKAGNKAKQKSFLTRALEVRHSWDRVLAIEEWKKLYGSFPNIEAEGYELTMMSAEAHEAFAAVLAQIEGGGDFTFTREQPELDKAFYHSIGTTELESFLPSVKSVREIALPKFIAENKLGGVSFGGNSLDIHFPQLQDLAKKGLTSKDSFWLFAAALLLASGVALTALGLRDQRRMLAKRVSFLNQVVHELKTPLAGLKLSSQLMRRSGPSEKNLVAIDENVSRLDRLFDDIVQINRPETPAELVRTNAIDLQALIHEIATEFKPGEIKIETHPTKAVETETGRLRVLLRNLISNGVKYGKRVSIKVLELEGRTQIFIHDEGPGIPASDAKKIFSEFYRSPRAREVSPDGLGLGLALVRKAATEIGADVKVINAGTPGATFSVTLKQGLDA